MNKSILIRKLYYILLSHFGKQHWWPGETRDEIIIGAILTQNTSWSNVGKAILNLKKNNCISLKCINKATPMTIASLIRPAGFYNQKTATLKRVANYFINDFNKRILGNHLKFRKDLLSLKGIGSETADSILLYAFDIPIFVVDTYTRRVLERHGIIDKNCSYIYIQSLFQENVVKDPYIYNEYHALIVRLGKEFCTRKNPKCENCPIKKGRLT